MTTRSISDLLSNELTELQIRAARFSDITKIYDLARSLITKDVAGPGILRGILKRNRSTLLVVDETLSTSSRQEAQKDKGPESKPAAADDAIDLAKKTAHVTGFIATLPLTQAGVAALQAGRFSGRDVDPDWVCPHDERPEGVYIWGLAGATNTARASIWKSALYLERGAYPDVPYYATAGSEIGEKLLTRLGYQRLADQGIDAPSTLFARRSHILHSAFERDAA